MVFCRDFPRSGRSTIRREISPECDRSVTWRGEKSVETIARLAVITPGGVSPSAAARAGLLLLAEVLRAIHGGFLSAASGRGLPPLTARISVAARGSCASTRRRSRRVAVAGRATPRLARRHPHAAPTSRSSSLRSTGSPTSRSRGRRTRPSDGRRRPSAGRRCGPGWPGPSGTRPGGRRVQSWPTPRSSTRPSRS